MTAAKLTDNPLRDGIHARRTPDPCAMVIFGASGDLTERKLVPALYYLARERLLPPGVSVVGGGRTRFTDEEFREKMRQAVKNFLKLPEGEDAFLKSFSEGIFYLTGDFSK